MSLIWVNGTLTDKLAAAVSPFDHGFLYGDGVWEPLRVFGGQLFRPHEHLRQLFETATGLGIDIPLSEPDLLAAVEATVRANNRTDGYIRVIVSRGPGTIGPDPRKIMPQVWIIAEEYQPFPQELYGHGLHAVTFPVASHGPRTLGQPHLVQAKWHALMRGCLDAILTNPAGEFLGTTEGMLFLVKDGAVVVAGKQPADVTGFAVATLAAGECLVVGEHTVASADMTSATELFLTGTSCGIIGIVRVDETQIGGGSEGPITRQLRERYVALTHAGG